MADTSALAPLQLTQFTLEELHTPEGVANLNQWISLHTQRLNALGPSTGSSAEFPNGIDLSGAHAVNVGGVGPQHTAITLATAEARYSAKALAPQLEAGQPNSLKSVRRINDPNQRESFSNFLEGTLNTAPTTNTATITGSGSTCTVSAGFHLLVSGNVQSFGARTDTVSLPSSFTIATLTRTSSTVTCVTTLATGYTVGSVVNIGGVSDSSFNGSFVLVTAVGTTLTWRQVAPDSTATGGTVSESGVYYYRLATNAKVLSLYGPYSTDSQQNRLSVNKDGGVGIAVAVFNGSGFDPTQSAAGATPPAANSQIRIINRL
jgi:hypothetical protein